MQVGAIHESPLPVSVFCPETHGQQVHHQPHHQILGLRITLGNQQRQRRAAAQKTTWPEVLVVSGDQRPAELVLQVIGGGLLDEGVFDVAHARRSILRICYTLRGHKLRFRECRCVHYLDVLIEKKRMCSRTALSIFRLKNVQRGGADALHKTQFMTAQGIAPVHWPTLADPCLVSTAAPNHSM